MGNSRAIYGHKDIQRVLDRAGESKDGLKLRFPDAREARYFIGRCNSFRHLDRKQNMILYHLGHPLHPTQERGESIYDGYRISQRDNIVFIISYMALLDTYHIVDVATGKQLHIGPEGSGFIPFEDGDLNRPQPGSPEPDPEPIPSSTICHDS